MTVLFFRPSFEAAKINTVHNEDDMKNLKGWRTLAFQFASVAILALLNEMQSIDWTEYVSPTTALILMALVNTGLRLVTNTPVASGQGGPAETPQRPFRSDGAENEQ